MSLVVPLKDVTLVHLFPIDKNEEYEVGLMDARVTQQLVAKKVKLRNEDAVRMVRIRARNQERQTARENVWREKGIKTSQESVARRERQWRDKQRTLALRPPTFGGFVKLL